MENLSRMGIRARNRHLLQRGRDLAERLRRQRRGVFAPPGEAIAMEREFEEKRWTPAPWDAD